MTPQRTWARWWLANAACFAVGYALFSPVAHWFSGPHGEELTLGQLAMHTFGLVIVCVSVIQGQRWALRLPVSISRCVVGSAIGSGLFWAAWYVKFEDFLVLHAALALAAWVSWRDFRGWRIVGSIGMLITFVIGSVASALTFVALASRDIVPSEVHTSELAHALWWITVGVGTGVVGGGLSAPIVSLMNRADSGDGPAPNGD